MYKRQGEIRVIVNVAVLTEGWDHPPTSCVVLLRPSSYKSTMIQMVGRGLRIVDPEEHPGIVKTDCVVLDFGTSSLIHGTLEQDVDLNGKLDPGDAPTKACPGCGADIPLAATECPLCGEAFPREDLDLWELRHARRRGGESSYRHQRKNQFYPLYVDPQAGQVVRAGESLPLDQEPSFEPVGGLVPLWPIDKEGNQRCWRYIPESMQRKIDGGFVVLGQTSADGKSWTVNYWVQKTQRKKYKTVWWSTSHDAGTHGTSMLHKLLGDRTAFPFPKSLYAVRDTLLTVVRDRPNALILDFFAGSGTTLHATALINALDGGQRRCILVSNNEVAAKSSDRLLRGCLLYTSPSPRD